MKKGDDIRELERAVGYKFKKKKLLRMALIHRSFRFENEGVSVDNQRLEFLGDAVLGFLTAADAYGEFPDWDEGALTAIRSRTTSGKALAECAHAIDLGRYLQMGKGEERSGGRSRPSNLADALEAVIGAAFLDGKTRAARKIFLKLLAPRMKGSDADVLASNPKGRLQEYSQNRWKAEPRYATIKREGPAHAALFTVRVTLPDGTQEVGKAPNKQEAESRAASRVLRTVGQE